MSYPNQSFPVLQSGVSYPPQQYFNNQGYQYASLPAQQDFSAYQDQDLVQNIFRDALLVDNRVNQQSAYQYLSAPQQGYQVLGGSVDYRDGYSSYYGGNVIQEYVQPLDPETYQLYEHRRSNRKNGDSNNSTDESIHLVQRRKGANKEKKAAKENGSSNEAKAEAAASAEASANAAAQVTTEAAAPVEAQNSKNAEVKKDATQENVAAAASENKKPEEEKKKEESDKEKKKRSKSADKAKSKDRKHRHHHRRHYYQEERYAPGSYGDYFTDDYYLTDRSYLVDALPSGAQYGATFAQYNSSSVDDEDVLGAPGAPYEPIGEPIVPGSIRIGPDAIVEPIVTIGPRTDVGVYQEEVVVPSASVHSVNVQVQQVPQPQPQVVVQQVVVPPQPQLQQQVVVPLQPQLQQQVYSRYEQYAPSYQQVPQYYAPPQPQYVPQYVPQQVPQQWGAYQGGSIYETQNVYYGNYNEQVFPLNAAPRVEEAEPVYQQQQVQVQPSQVQQQQYQFDGYNLPPGSRIVSEYVVGYLNGEEAKKEEVVVELWEKKEKKHRKPKQEVVKAEVVKPKSPLPVPVVQPVEAKPVEVKADFSSMRNEIISTIQSELSKLKLTQTSDDSSQPIQPIFLMPKSEGEQKPIYVPRNVYVPVVRPVFVPRERIIVRPQIIHVARPVLVDRPVPVQQRPIVIERDRPVPVRVETVEKIENLEPSSNVIVESVSKPLQNEVVYETINYPSEYTVQETQKLEDQYKSYNDSVTYQFSSEEYNKFLEEESRRLGGASSTSAAYYTESSNLNDKAYVVDSQSSYSVANEEEKRRQEIQQLINDVEKTKWDLQQSKTSYTLEVLDPSVSNKYESVDQNSLKNIYGIGESSYQYLPYESSTREYYSSEVVGGGVSSGVGAAVDSGVSYVSSELYGDSQSVNLGSATPVVIQNVQKIIQNFGSPYSSEVVVTSASNQ